MTDYALQAQHAAEERLTMLDEALDAAGLVGTDGLGPPWPADLIAPYCGCLTCVVREALHAAWPFMEQAILAELSTTEGQT